MDPQPATPADVPDLLSIFRACFHDAYFNAIFPPNDTGTSYLVDAFTRFVTPGEPSNIAVVRDETGVRAILIYNHENNGPSTGFDRWPPHREGMDKSKMDEFFDGMDQQHKSVMGPREHMYAELIMVRPDSRRRGLGSRLVEYAVELADGKPVYLDSKGHALGMYERLGFSTVGENVKTSELMTPMVRPGRESR